MKCPTRRSRVPCAAHRSLFARRRPPRNTCWPRGETRVGRIPTPQTRPVQRRSSTYSGACSTAQRQGHPCEGALVCFLRGSTARRGPLPLRRGACSSPQSACAVSPPERSRASSLQCRSLAAPGRPCPAGASYRRESAGSLGLRGQTKTHRKHTFPPARGSGNLSRTQTPRRPAVEPGRQTRPPVPAASEWRPAACCACPVRRAQSKLPGPPAREPRGSSLPGASAHRAANETPHLLFGAAHVQAHSAVRQSPPHEYRLDLCPPSSTVPFLSSVPSCGPDISAGACQAQRRLSHTPSTSHGRHLDRGCHSSGFHSQL
mmetsp:Transcript_10501/g.32116  ORF Transcript_10501/g.32116 Transcript_10501/m.32116 type:complete len:317 (+) Transcript_10501:1347-2297(+)